METTAGDIAAWSVAITAFAALIGIVVAVIGGVRGILAIGKWVGNRESFENGAQKAIDRIDKAVEEIRQDIKEIFRRLPAEDLVGTNSPLSLTDTGKVVAKELDATGWVSETVPAITEKGLITDDSPYGIQDFCFDYVKPERKNLSEDMLAKVKQSAFDHGSNIDKVVIVLAIRLRDELLAIYHPELSDMLDDPPAE